MKEDNCCGHRSAVPSFPVDELVQCIPQQAVHCGITWLIAQLVIVIFALLPDSSQQKLSTLWLVKTTSLFCGTCTYVFNGNFILCMSEAIK